MKQKNTISFDEQKFSKASKKLLNKFNDLVQEDQKLKLTQVQEMLSKSFGYRNYYDLKKTFDGESNLSLNENQVLSKVNDKKGILQNMNLEQIMNLINLFMHKDNSLWRERAISFIEALLFALIELKDKKLILLDINCIKEYLLLDNIIKLSKNENLSNNAKSVLRSYLNSVPGYQEDAVKLQLVVYEQHGYISTQFSGVLWNLEKIEKDNFIVADESWFTSMPGKKLILHYNVRNIDFIEDSWLDIEAYEDWIFGLHKVNKLKNVTILDLFQYVGTIMSPVKRDKMFSLLNVFLDNFYTAQALSEKICMAVKKVD